MTPDAAETLALRALAWIAGDEEMLAQLSAATGAAAANLHGGAQDPVFLAGILQFLAMEDRWITAFCDDHGLSYDAPLRALAALPGGRREEWP